LPRARRVAIVFSDLELKSPSKGTVEAKEARFLLVGEGRIVLPHRQRESTKITARRGPPILVGRGGGADEFAGASDATHKWAASASSGDHVDPGLKARKGRGLQVALHERLGRLLHDHTFSPLLAGLGNQLTKLGHSEQFSERVGLAFDKARPTHGD
jgi:hypothetical protein